MSQSDVQSQTPESIRGLAADVARQLAETAVERDQRGGTAKAERDLLRASGLLRLSTPLEHGGAGAGWALVQEVVRALARADGSLAHLYGFHHLMLATVRLFGTRAQWARAYEEATQAAQFWGNALNPLDPRTTIAPAPGGFVLNGGKSFCSGASDSDRLVVSALRVDDHKLVIGTVPTARAGITVHQDWDNMGQRQTDSGSVDFVDVRVAEDELLRTPGPLGSTFASLRPCIAQLVLANVYLGLAEGAFAHARAYTRAQTKPRSSSAAAAGTVAASDPYTLRDYGSLYVDLEGARLLTDAAGAALERAWARGDELTPRQRGETSVAVALAKASTTRVGLDVATRVFDLTSARATTRKDGFDRFWRNLRTHTLHDPVDYKLRELGEFALNDVIPTPSFYS
jgi:alkylation response protein AidB-like acyl-CoA dehydrogenase